ncbi:MAG: sulfate adenylyltransferase [Nitrospinae bacterium]|nr:sulfate adenylyltransferase [Nitrospinota bacterium]
MPPQNDPQEHPHLLVPEEERAALEREAANLPHLSLNARQLCELELLLNGGFAPLRGYSNRKDYDCVLESMRLENGALWPIPVALDVSGKEANGIEKRPRLALRDEGGEPLAVLDAEDLWRADPEREAQDVFGTLDRAHPGVRYLFEETNPFYIGGRLRGIRLPRYADFPQYRHAPGELREKFRAMGWKRIVAFQTRNPLHRAHVELTQSAASQNRAGLLLHPVAGMTKPGDVDHICRVRCYEHVLKHYAPGSVTLSLLPLAMRMAGPREALWHALIRKNYGCTHFIVGRDHAGPGVDGRGEPFYDPYAAQDLLRTHQAECGIEMVPFQEMVYAPDEGRYLPVDRIPENTRILRISGTRLREMMASGEEIPEWFTYAEVAEELRRYSSSKNP